MKKRTTMFLALVLCVTLIAACSQAPADKGNRQPAQTESTMLPYPKDVKIATPPGGGAAVTQGVCSLLSKEYNITATPYSGSGATDRLMVMLNNEAELSMVSNDTIMNAFRGDGQFKEKGKYPVRVIGGIQIAPIHFATWKGSGITSVKDVKGKRFMYQYVTSPYVMAVGEGALEFNGLKETDVVAQKFSTTNDVMNALTDRSTDLGICPGSIAGSSYWMELANSNDILFLSLSQEERKYIVEKNPYLLETVTVPAGVYKGQEQDVDCVGFMNTFAVQVDTNDEFVYNLMKLLYDDTDLTKAGRFAQFHADAGAFTLKTALMPAGIAPFHDMAVKYFKDRGVWTDELEKIQKSLLAEVGATK